MARRSPCVLLRESFRFVLLGGLAGDEDKLPLELDADIRLLADCWPSLALSIPLASFTDSSNAAGVSHSFGRHFSRKGMHVLMYASRLTHVGISRPHRSCKTTEKMLFSCQRITKDKIRPLRDDMKCMVE